MSSTWTKCLVMLKPGDQKNLNPLGFVSREFSLIKEFIFISLTIKHLTILISCAVAVLMFGLTPTKAALINRITLDWGKLLNRKRPVAEVVSLGALLANKDAV